MELIRIFKNKKFIAAVITLLLLNCVSFYITQQKSLSDFGINIDAYSATFKDNADIFTEVDKKSIIEKSNKFEILKSFADNTEDKAQQIKEYPDLVRKYIGTVVPVTDNYFSALNSAVFSDGQEVNRDALIAMMAAILVKDYPNSTIVTDSVTSDKLTAFLEGELQLKHHRFQLQL